MMEPKRGAVALCSRGEPGLITSNNPVWVEYPGGDAGWAWVGVHLSKEKAGDPWSSRNPKILFDAIEIAPAAGPLPENYEYVASDD